MENLSLWSSFLKMILYIVCWGFAQRPYLVKK